MTTESCLWHLLLNVFSTNDAHSTRALYSTGIAPVWRMYQMNAFC